MAEKTADDIMKMIKDQNVEYVDIRFCDLPGVVQHFSIPAAAFDESVFEDGLAFDGSSVRGFQSIHESDMMLLPDPATAQIDPFRHAKTLNLNFFVHDPFTREAYSRDPRNVARKAENYLASTGIADTCFFGAEAEFYIFDSVSFDSRMNGTFYEVDSESGWWNSGEPLEADGSPNRGYKVRPKGGYFPVAPYDHYVDLRDQMATNLQNAGFVLERGHHEVGTGGQAEINYKFNTLLHAADDVLLFKYIIKNTAWANGKTATFMPKPLFGDNGSGMHCHQSLWKDGEPLFYDEKGYGGLSDVGRPGQGDDPHEQCRDRHGGEHHQSGQETAAAEGASVLVERGAVGDLRDHGEHSKATRAGSRARATLRARDSEDLQNLVLCWFLRGQDHNGCTRNFGCKNWTGILADVHEMDGRTYTRTDLSITTSIQKRC